MTKIQKAIIIHAPISKVSDLLDQQDRLAEWFAGITAVNPEPGYPKEVGSKNVMAYKSMGVTFNTTMTTLSYEPEGRRVYKMDGMITGKNQWDLAPEGDGTKVTMTFDYKMPGGGVGKIMDKLLIERQNEKNAVTSLKNLKAMCERE